MFLCEKRLQSHNVTCATLCKTINRKRNKEWKKMKKKKTVNKQHEAERKKKLVVKTCQTQ